jgi:hypothetical protein
MTKTRVTPWSDNVHEDALRVQRAACFALGCLEREHRLNVDALVASWMQASTTWWKPAASRAHAPQPRLSASRRPTGAR